MPQLSYSLGAACNVDFSRPIGRLDWFRGFSQEKARIEAIMSPILACLPNSRDWSRRVTFTLQPQTAGHAFPLKRAENCNLGALYYLDTFEPVGANYGSILPKNAVTLYQNKPVRQRPIAIRNFVTRLAPESTSLYCGDTAPARIRNALEVHAPVPQGLGIFAISLNDGSLLIAPCSELMLGAYSAILQRDSATLLGDARPQNEIWYNGFRFCKDTDRGKLTFYPYRYVRSERLASAEVESILPRAFSFRTSDGGLPFLIRPATTGRVRIRARTHTYDDEVGRIHAATSVSIGLPFEKRSEPIHLPSAYAPQFFMSSVWLSAAGHHAPWKRWRNQRHYDTTRMLRNSRDADDFFRYWYDVARVDIIKFGKSLLHAIDDGDLEAGRARSM